MFTTVHLEIHNLLYYSLNKLSKIWHWVGILVVMEKLSFKIAWRNLWKNKGFALINLGGLAVGLASSLLLLLYIANEWKFNTQYKDAENIFEVKINKLDYANNVVSTTEVTPNAL